jgi:type II secretory ATPase GspE/PulE/Tfp pilus assembly ATPase PilB-like protein
MISFDTFKVAPLEKEIFDSIYYEQNSLGEANCLFDLELYKVVDRFTIVDTLKKEYPLLCSIETVNRDNTLRDTEERFGVIIDKISNRELNVIYPVLSNNINKSSLSIKLSQYKLNWLEVTRLNFLQLQGTDISTFYNEDLLFKRIVVEAINLKATDLHFSVEHTENGVEYPLYYRSGSQLFKLSLFELDKKLNNALISKFIERKTTDISLDISDSAGVTTSTSALFKTRAIELRVSANKVNDGTRCVIRIQEKKTTSLHVDELGFAAKVTDGIKELACKRNGITFITGAIRTGKNTTAFAIANEIHKDNVSLISYDSPIEVLMPFPQVDYRESPERLLNCVRLAKKQDIDIAFLNEIPSKDVAFAVKDLVNSSIGVVTTLHLNRLWDLPYRLFEYYGDSYKDVIAQINGVVNQKMFSVPCPHCLKTMRANDVENSTIRKLLEANNVQTVYVNDGCVNCYNIYTGTYGTVIGKNQPYAEFLIFDEEIRSSLLRFDSTWEMAEYLKGQLLSRKQNLEVFMIEAIKQGRLSYEALQYII